MNRPDTNGNHEYPRADTPELSAGLYSASGASAADEFLDAVATKLAEKVGGGSDGGPPKKTFLGLNAGGWTTLLVGLVLAALATVGGWALLVRDRLQRHDVEIETLTKLPGHPQTIERVEGVEKRVGAVEEAVHAIGEKQTHIAQGIDELKKENIEKLKDEVRNLRRENRKLQDR